MTGFGRAGAQAGRFNLTVEARSVNQKGLHIHLNLPDQLLSMEQDVREEVRNRYSRGRIDIRASLEAPGGLEEAPPVDFERARTLSMSAALLASELGIEKGLTAASLMRLHGVLRPPVSDEVPDLQIVMAAVRRCLDDLSASRRSEGTALAGLLSVRLEKLRTLAAGVACIQKESVPAGFERLKERVARLIGDAQVDGQRLLQELALMADRLDVAEELERLECHLASSLALAASDEPDAGRKLGFLLQEIQREVNTLGAKLETPEGTMIVVEMKNELASLREQVANVE